MSNHIEITIPKYTEADIIVRQWRIEQTLDKMKAAKGLEKIPHINRYKLLAQLYNEAVSLEMGKKFEAYDVNFVW